LFKNLSLITIISLFGKAIGFLNLTLIIKNINTSEFNELSATLSVAALFIPIISLSFDSYLPILKEKIVNKIIFSYLVLILFLSLVLGLFNLLFIENYIYCIAVVFAFSTIFQNTLINYYLSNNSLKGQIFVVFVFSVLVEMSKLYFILFQPFDSHNLIKGAILSVIIAILLSAVSVKLKVQLFFPKKLLKNKNVIEYVSFRTLSVFVQNVSLQLIPLYVYKTSNGNVAALIFMAVSLSTVLFQVIGRRFSDTFNHKLIMVSKKDRINIINKFLICLFVLVLAYHFSIVFSLYYGNEYLPNHWKGVLYFYIPYSIYASFQLVAYPIQQSLGVINKSKFYFIDSIVRLLIVACVILISKFYDLEIMGLVWLYCIIMSCYFCCILTRNIRWLV